MNLIRITVAICLIFSASAITSCSENAQPEEEVHMETAAVFACPMDCEDGKTYSEEGDCPVCNMALVEQTEEGHDDHDHDHDGHDH